VTGALLSVNHGIKTGRDYRPKTVPRECQAGISPRPSNGQHVDGMFSAAPLPLRKRKNDRWVAAAAKKQDLTNGATRANRVDHLMSNQSPYWTNIGRVCWHGIWPDGFCGVWGLAAPIGLRRRASSRWLVATMGLACPHAEEEA